MEQVTLVAAVIAAVAAVLSAVIAARSSRRQSERVAELARRAELHEDLTRWIDWAVNGTDRQALFAIRMLRALTEVAELDGRQLSAVVAAATMAHDRSVEADPVDPGLPAIDLPSRDDESDTGVEEGWR